MNDVEACVKTLLRAERDGRFGGGELNADAVQASSILTLKLDWRRVHARLSCSPVQGDLATFCRWANVMLDHLSLADGSLLLNTAMPVRCGPSAISC